MMNEIYFENIPQIGDLYLDYVFHEFEGEPILFTCINKTNQLFLCTCFEIRHEQKWLIAECTLETLEEMIDNAIDIKTALCKNGIITTVIMDIEGVETYNCKKAREINELDFPKEGTFLKLHGAQEKLYLEQKIKAKDNTRRRQSVSWYFGEIRAGEKNYSKEWSFKEKVELLEFCFDMNILGKDVKRIACSYEVNKNIKYKESENNGEIENNINLVLAA